MLFRSWEQCKLGDITESYYGGTTSVNNKEYYGSKIPFIRSAEINKDKTELYITKKGLNDSSAKMVSVLTSIQTYPHPCPKRPSWPFQHHPLLQVQHP